MDGRDLLPLDLLPGFTLIEKNKKYNYNKLLSNNGTFINYFIGELGLMFINVFTIKPQKKKQRVSTSAKKLQEASKGKILTNTLQF